MEDLTLVWHDASKEQPCYNNPVLVLTDRALFAIAELAEIRSDDYPGWEYTGDYTWFSMYGSIDYDVWDDEDLGKISYWAELPTMIEEE